MPSLIISPAKPCIAVADKLASTSAVASGAYFQLDQSSSGNILQNISFIDATSASTYGGLQILYPGKYQITVSMPLDSGNSYNIYNGSTAISATDVPGDSIFKGIATLLRNDIISIRNPASAAVNPTGTSAYVEITRIN